MDKESAQFAILHASYEKKALRWLLAEYRKILKNINYKNLSFDPRVSRALIEINFDRKSLEKLLYKIHYSIGMSYGNIVARKLRKDFPIQKKAFNPLPFFNVAFQKYLLDYYKEKGGELISTLSKTMADRVVEEIISGTFENETLEQLAKRIQKTVNNPEYYSWMCMRIARTETGFAMNSANFTAGGVSGVLMEKVWVSRNDGRERSSHLAKNGKALQENEYYEFGNGVKLRYPGDRDGKGSGKSIAKEVINCRCTIGWRAKRDENGRLIFTDEI